MLIEFMVMTYKLKICLVVVIILVGAGKASADEWYLPKTAKYFSANRKYKFTVIPRQIESQLKYYKDKVSGKANAGAVQGTEETSAKGILSKRNALGLHKTISTFPLVNDVSPVSALVSNNGEYIVTFDNWHETGYGDNVIVIYRSNGTLVRKFGLLDFLTEGDVETLPRSTSSIWWGGDHYIDNSRGELVVRVVSNRIMPYESEATFIELRISLASGLPLEPKKDRLLQLLFSVNIGPDKGGGKSEAIQASQRCSVPGSAWNTADFVSSIQLFENAKDLPAPQYPPLAKGARIQGAVIIEMLISPTGQVLCARAVAGHPLLWQSGVESALKWRFESNLAGNDRPVTGTLEIDYKMYESTGPGTGQTRK